MLRLIKISKQEKERRIKEENIKNSLCELDYQDINDICKLISEKLSNTTEKEIYKQSIITKLLEEKGEELDNKSIKELESLIELTL